MNCDKVKELLWAYCGSRRHEGDAGNAAEPERGDRADSV